MLFILFTYLYGIGIFLMFNDSVYKLHMSVCMYVYHLCVFTIAQPI
jgi:hypothetical protein